MYFTVWDDTPKGHIFWFPGACITTEWQHVRVIYGTINGEKIMSAQTISRYTRNTDVGTGILQPYNSNIHIGSQRNNNPFGGLIDEVRVAYYKTPVCGDWGYYDGDFNRDCYINVEDLAALGENWLASTDPADENWQLGQSDSYVNYNIPFTSSAPTIDGSIAAGEWTDAKAVELVYPDIVTYPQLGSIKYQAAPSSADISGLWLLKWDNTYLYTAAVVTDADLVLASGYPQDLVEFGLNLYNDTSNTFADDAAFYNMYRGSDSSTYVENITSAPMTPTNAVKASSITANGYVIETALKWSDFKEPNDVSYIPILGDVHGMTLSLGDDDGSGIGDPDGNWMRDIGKGDPDQVENLSMWHTATLVNSLACGDHGYLITDVAEPQDCITNMPDFGDFADTWMKCTDPNYPTDCDELPWQP